MKEYDFNDAEEHGQLLQSVERSQSIVGGKSTKSTVSTFKTDELTAHCPFDFGGPDFYTLVLRYEADDQYVESKSLKKFIESYRDREITVEDLAEEIHDLIYREISPVRCYLRLEQQRRGGIEETVEVGNKSLRLVNEQ